MPITTFSRAQPRVLVRRPRCLSHLVRGLIVSKERRAITRAPSAPTGPAPPTALDLTCRQDDGNGGYRTGGSAAARPAAEAAKEPQQLNERAARQCVCDGHRFRSSNSTPPPVEDRRRPRATRRRPFMPRASPRPHATRRLSTGLSWTCSRGMASRGGRSRWSWSVVRLTPSVRAICANPHVAAVAHRQRCGFLFGGELHRAAAESAGGFGDFPAGLAAFADQLALELCKGRRTGAAAAVRWRWWCRSRDPGGVPGLHRAGWPMGGGWSWTLAHDSAGLYATIGGLSSVARRRRPHSTKGDLDGACEEQYLALVAPGHV